MRRPTSRRLTPIRIVVLANLALVASLYAYIQWRFSTPQQVVRLNAAAEESTEKDLQSAAKRLEGASAENLAQGQSSRMTSLFVDWETVAAQGADKFAADWESSTDKKWFEKPGYHLVNAAEDPPYPYQLINYIDGRPTGIIAVAAPFYDTNYYRGESARALFWRLKARGHVMIGLSSYQEYPGKIANPYDDRHVTPQDLVIYNAMDAWLHCFREPDKFLPLGVPRLLLSESDFHDPDRNDGAAGGSLIPSDKVKKEFDIVYSNQGGEWNDFARNWTLAKACFKNLMNELGLKVLILGRELGKEADKDLQPFIESGSLTWEPPGKTWREFLLAMQSARSLFVPNVHDASPRVIVEALCLDVPVVVNTHILGGWKYVNQYTGEFFSDADDVVAAFRKLRSPDRAAELFPREWFKGTWGKTIATYKLKAFMDAVVGEERLKTIQKDLELFSAKNQQ